jgi:hypothetical protein
MAFEPGEKYRTAVDLQTGAVVTVRSAGSSISLKRGEYSKPDGTALKFDIELKPVSGKPNVIINAVTLEAMLRAQGRTETAQNTQLVNDIFHGLAAIDGKWSLMRNTQFGSNYEEYARKGAKFSFVLPSDEELKQLTA